MEFFRDTKIDFMKYRKVFVPISAVLLLLGFAALMLGQLNVGIDFAGGTELTLRFREQPQIDDLRKLLADAGMPDATLQRFGDADSNDVLLRTQSLDESEGDGESEGQEGAEAAEAEGGAGGVLSARYQEVVDALDSRYNEAAGAGLDLNRIGVEALSEALTVADPDGVAATELDEGASHYHAIAESVIDLRRDTGLIESWDSVGSAAGVSPAVLTHLQGEGRLGNFTIRGVGNVGPQIGKELRSKGMMAVLLSMLGMLAYIWFRFELRFGVGALVAIFHDVAITLGLYVWGGFEFNLTTIAAFLTVVGYSVNDTVVVFDRVRENMGRHRRMPLVDLMNLSLNQTLSRTILTSSTTFLAVATLFFLGGDVLKGFAFIIMIGVIIGTYSSIFIACPFALFWDNFFSAEARARRAAA